MRLMPNLPIGHFKNHNSSFKSPKERSLLTTSVLLCNYSYFMHLIYLKISERPPNEHHLTTKDPDDEKFPYVEPKKTLF